MDTTHANTESGAQIATDTVITQWTLKAVNHALIGRSRSRQSNAPNAKSAEARSKKNLEQLLPTLSQIFRRVLFSIAQSLGTFSIPPSKAPDKLFGTLTPTSGSVFTSKILLYQRITCYGRDRSSTFVHPDSMDTRVPRNAIDIIFWRPGIERSRCWQEALDEIYPIITTRTSAYIRINATKLKRGKKCWKYGKLYTGDTICVFGPRDPTSSRRDEAADYLRFKARFYIGRSKRMRPGGEPFTVEHEMVKYRQHQLRRSGKSSQLISRE